MNAGKGKEGEGRHVEGSDGNEEKKKKNSKKRSGGGRRCRRTR